MHPDVAKRLRAEVLEQCGIDKAPSFEDIKNMKYSTYTLRTATLRSTDMQACAVRAVINETLRILPPVATNSRESRPHPSIFPKSDGTFPEPADPLYMPPLTPIAYFPILMQRNPALWGPDADAFDPERWLDKRASRFIANPLMFAPFSAGPRIVSVSPASTDP